MAITPQQIQTAQVQQHKAARDTSPQVRLIAGPGTGKSYAIQERVHWLLSQGIVPSNIYIVSFTRASARDLRERIQAYCKSKGQPNVVDISVTTLHSLALRTLRIAGLLAYPTDPLVLDDWELENLHDPEYSSATGFRPSQAGNGSTRIRAKEIRLDYEAFCGTGIWQPPGYISPPQPVTPRERSQYDQFHRERTQLYSYVLPGEIVRQCVDHMRVGSLNPATVLGIAHLVVDEYQDLNPSDLAFVDILIQLGVIIFVAGDDDQSLYSFRYASPSGIQTFLSRHPKSTDYSLTDCFRTTPNILSPALALITTFPNPNRIPKQLSSLYTASNPVEPGLFLRWQFSTGELEARIIAESCRNLISIGMPPREIMILLSNTRVILPRLKVALDNAAVPYESPRTESYFDTRPGRFAFALVRLACDPNDYVAHRLLFGLRPRVGPNICNTLAQTVITNNLNYRDIFYQPIPQGIFQQREINALQLARVLCAQVSQWQQSDTLAQRLPDIENILLNIFGQEASLLFRDQIGHLPLDTFLGELRDYLWADNDEQRAGLLVSIYERLALQPPNTGFLPPQIRIMTMHGSKGLSATVVFIPSLEEQILPGPRRQPYPGLVLEAARMLYVSITRARAACILSYARTRIVYGTFSNQIPSRFVPYLAGPFSSRTNPLDLPEVSQIMQSRSNL